MPQIVAAVLIGAGLAAGMKWLVKELSKVADPMRVAPHERERSQPVACAPKDLGALVYDAKSGVYRPADKRAG
jgi:hypothetical protein